MKSWVSGTLAKVIFLAATLGAASVTGPALAQQSGTVRYTHGA